MSAAERVREALADGMAGAGLVGVTAAARLPDGEAVEIALGVRGVDNPAPMTSDTVFWVASCTKALTAVAAMQLVEVGKLDLDEPVDRWLPVLAAPKLLKGFDEKDQAILEPATAPITLRRLLTHTSGLAYGFTSPPLERFLAAATAGDPMAPDQPLVFEPGQGWVYGIGLDWTGRLVEAASGESFDAYMHGHVLGPLGMGDTSFFRSPDQLARSASMHARTPDGGMVPIPFAMPAEPHFGMGGGGLYSTAPDYLRFLDYMLGDGEPLLGADAMTALCTPQVEGLDVGTWSNERANVSNAFDPFPGAPKAWTLGFVSNLEPGPNGRAAGSLAWAGLSNCYYWIDRTSGAAAVMCAQFLPFADHRALEVFGTFERAVYAG